MEDDPKNIKTGMFQQLAKETKLKIAQNEDKLKSEISNQPLIGS